MIGLFVVVEGPDGVGKSTLVKALEAHYYGIGVHARATCEPTEGPVGWEIRQILKGAIPDPGPAAMVAKFAEDRLDHLAEFVLPLLSDGALVICDRYVLSSIAYQVGPGATLEQVLHANRFAPAPDLTIILDAPPEVCAERRAAKGGAADITETEEYQQRVRAVFMGDHGRYCAGHSMVRLDSRASIEALTARAVRAIDEVRGS